MVALVLAVVGTAATVVATILAVLQLRRTPGSRRPDQKALSVAADRVQEGKSALAAPGRSGASPTLPGTQANAPAERVVLLPPTGRLSEVRGRGDLLSVLAQTLAAPDGNF